MREKVLYQLRDKAIWVVLVVLCVAFTIANPRFINPTNIFTLLRQVSIYGIASIGMTFVILLGDIDLSTGTVISFVNIICAYMMVNWGMNMILAIFITLCVSTLIGLLNGFMVSTIGIPALIATFAVQTSFSGLALLICGGLPIYGFTDNFKLVAQTYVFGIIPTPVIIMVACFIIGSFILNRTYFGRYFYAVGGNSEAAELSGISVRNVKYLVFAMAGFFSGLAGIVMLSRTNSGMATNGEGYEFKVITCVVLGGVSVSGGYGKMSGVICGTCIIGVLQNGMVLMNINTYIQDIVMGIVLVIAVGFDAIQKKSRES